MQHNIALTVQNHFPYTNALYNFAFNARELKMHPGIYFKIQ